VDVGDDQVPAVVQAADEELRAIEAELDGLRALPIVSAASVQGVLTLCKRKRAIYSTLFPLTGDAPERPVVVFKQEPRFLPQASTVPSDDRLDEWRQERWVHVGEDDRWVQQVLVKVGQGWWKRPCGQPEPHCWRTGFLKKNKKKARGYTRAEMTKLKMECRRLCRLRALPHMREDELSEQTRIVFDAIRRISACVVSHIHCYADLVDVCKGRFDRWALEAQQHQGR
jgi:hypothetical protein